jgi:S1-C subfamily serine protease
MTAVLALVLVLVLGAGTAAVVTTALVDEGGTTTRQVTVTNASPAVATTSGGFTVNGVYEAAHESVVEIASTSSQPNEFGGEQEALAQGSGWIYDRQGRIVTNQHVVNEATSVKVTFWNGAAYDARVLGTDPDTDLAVLELQNAPASLLKPLRLADSDAVKVGEGVVAIGSPFGLQQTVTAGIVSALNRSMTAPNEFTINNTIQTDAPINHGNSGGPLLNLRGEVIGVNSQIESRNGGNVGVGFAVPSNTVRTIATQLIATGEVVHAYLGVSVTEIPASAAEDLSVEPGVAVREVHPNTPAQRAGLRAAAGQRAVDGVPYPTGGDIITAIDGDEVTTSSELQNAIDAKQPGDTIVLTVVRNDDEREVEVTLAERPESVEDEG